MVLTHQNSRYASRAYGGFAGCGVAGDFHTPGIEGIGPHQARFFGWQCGDSFSTPTPPTHKRNCRACACCHSGRRFRALFKGNNAIVGPFMWAGKVRVRRGPALGTWAAFARFLLCTAALGFEACYMPHSEQSNRTGLFRQPMPSASARLN